MPTPLPRSKVKQNQTWNAESVFRSPKEFDAAVKSLLETLPDVKQYQGRLGDSPDMFIKAMTLIEEVLQRAMKIQVYATMSSAVDANDQQAAARRVVGEGGEMFGHATGLGAPAPPTIAADAQAAIGHQGQHTAQLGHLAQAGHISHH